MFTFTLVTNSLEQTAKITVALRKRMYANDTSERYALSARQGKHHTMRYKVLMHKWCVFVWAMSMRKFTQKYSFVYSGQYAINL